MNCTIVSGLRASVSGAALLAILTIPPATAFAADFTIPGASATTVKTVGGADHGTIGSGASLVVNGANAIVWSGAATGIVIDNYGLVQANTRAIDTTGTLSGNFTLNNYLGATITSANDAFRINNNLSSGKVSIDNAGTIVSQTGQALDFALITSGDAVVDITNSGTIESKGDDAIRPGAGTITILNSGKILSTQSAARGININNAGTLKRFELTNSEGALISAVNDAIRVSEIPTVGEILIDNAGTIRSIGLGADSGQAIDLNNVATSGATIKIINRATGLIETADADAIRPGANGVVENYGQIIGKSPDPNSSSDGIDFQDTNAGTVNNYGNGLISGARHGITGKQTLSVYNDVNATIIGNNGSGINYDTVVGQEPVKVVNYGTIIGTFNPDASYGDGDGVDIDAIGHIYNYGSILGQGSNGTKVGDPGPATSEGIAIGGGIIVNGDATHRNAVISGIDNGILVDDSETGPAFDKIAITNYGTIEGKAGFGIRMIGTQQNTIVNYGSIIGADGIAVEMSDGDETFVYQAGSSVSGTVDAGAGSDTLRLGEISGSFNLALLGDGATYRHFDTLDLTAGSAWALSGSTDFSGATQVTDALLTLSNASLARSQLMLGDNGRLEGQGTVGGLTVGSGGTVALGAGTAGVATLIVAGDVTFEAGSVYAVSVNAAGASDHIAATGSATLSDGAIALAKPVAGSYSLGTTYTILSAEGGLNGTTFGGENGQLADAFAFLDASLSYDAKNVYLTLSRNDVSFASVGQTANQRSVAAAVEGDGAGSPIYDQLLVERLDVLPGALDALSGEIHADAAGVLMESSHLLRDTLIGRARDGSAGAAGDKARGISDLTFWTSALGSWGSADSDGNAARLDHDTAGFLVGADGLVVQNWRFGAAAGFSRSRFDAEDRASSGSSDNYHVALYGGTEWGALAVRLGAAYTWHDIETRRTVAFSDFLDSVRGDTKAGTAQAFGEIAYTVKAGDIAFEPFAGLSYVNVDTHGFAESGGAAALTAKGGGMETTFTTLGLRAETVLGVIGTSTLTARASLGWRHAIGDVTPASTLAFGAGTAFTVAGAPIDRDVAVLDFGINARLARNVSLNASYAGQLGKSGDSHGLRAGLAVDF
ncbi:MAG: autotransporter domain-containing protein [Mesorhizobium sp.]|uniref:autotransporter domain-containing protein n=1 Tax=Mesorhizobium sp. TaxID=1871066 RepID=UPI001AC77C96|nr:autotransporter domain-containing protein [Mesorhizobium sp.]MBN9220879.1 autotransporter domain-containing protein [Mesorhizobium sp.]